MVDRTESTRECYVLSKDGQCELYHKMWRESGELTGAVFIVHGLGEHCNRYDRIIEFLVTRGIRVYSYDHRGHGRTHQTIEGKRQGTRGHVHSSVDAIMEDIDLLVERADDDDLGVEVPRYLLGHSMGGLFVTYYACMRDVSRLSGLLVIAPALGIVNPPSIVLQKLAPIGAFLLPTVTIDGNFRVEHVSNVPEVVESLKNDPMIHGRVSMATGHLMMKMLRELETASEPEIRIPVLFIHGTDDNITDFKATEKFYEKLNCPAKSIYLLQGGYHRPHEDLNTELIFAEIETWINQIAAARITAIPSQ